ncbi:hypothetical protein O7600_11800 [Micromonospora sp. WMMA1998]|uniref:hypothetical protein n=1 Tax=Micromonospora sp. WMMA1998 TaxID=3015167 RepID=UPI00248BC371|nr:hypothetical protein [Micromonospora sp. WMMA1998]WBC17465.1 hypothetical protein O7600_11800 [Micromonospora sp. WMMA1998]
MEFSKAQYEGLLADISSGLNTLTVRLDQIPQAAAIGAGRWFVTPAVADAILNLGRQIVDIGKKVLDFLVDLLKGATAPIFMFLDAWDWMDMRGSASGVASALTQQHLVVDNSDWSGKARDAYVSSVAAHSVAATRISSIASSTSGHLLFCAGAGTAFYVTLAVVLAKLIAAATVAIPAMGSGVFSAPGAALFLEEAGFTAAVVGTAIVTLTAFLTSQATAMVNLHGEAVDNSSFPAGKWPSPNTSTYSDATVRDGDADWSLAPD